eukprot:XP_001693325.1 predicted protein [Chlamydomonas reinhardtii]
MWNQRREWRRIARRDDWVAEPAEPPPLPPPLGSQGQVGGGPTATRAPAAAGPAGLVVYGHCRPLDARERLVQAVWRAARAEPVAAALPAVQSRACADLVRRNKDLVAMFSTMQMTPQARNSAQGLVRVFQDQIAKSQARMQAAYPDCREVGRAALEFVHDFDTDAYRCGIVAAATCVVESGARVSMPGLTKADPAAPAVGAAAPGGGGACRPCPAYGASPQLEAEAGMVLLWALAVAQPEAWLRLARMSLGAAEFEGHPVGGHVGTAAATPVQQPVEEAVLVGRAGGGSGSDGRSAGLCLGELCAWLQAGRPVACAGGAAVWQPDGELGGCCIVLQPLGPLLLPGTEGIAESWLRHQMLAAVQRAGRAALCCEDARALEVAVAALCKARAELQLERPDRQLACAAWPVPETEAAATRGGGDRANLVAKRRGIAQYEPIAQIGTGAFGTVALAHNGAGLLVAVKATKTPDDPLSLRLAQREARALRLCNHPCIIKLLDCFRSPSGRAYLVLEYVNGCASTLLESCPRGLSPVALKLLAWQMCLALSHMHTGQTQLLHRDIKPSNILVSTEGFVKLCDFGLARALPRAGAPTSSARDSGSSPEASSANSCSQSCSDSRPYVAGSAGAQQSQQQLLSSYVVTRWYRPPEILLSQAYGPPADIFSLGTTIAELAVGIPLFPGASTTDQLNRLCRCFGPLPQHMTAALSAMAARSATPAVAAELSVVGAQRGRSLKQRFHTPSAAPTPEGGGTPLATTPMSGISVRSVATSVLSVLPSPPQPPPLHHPPQDQEISFGDGVGPPQQQQDRHRHHATHHAHVPAAAGQCRVVDTRSISAHAAATDNGKQQAHTHQPPLHATREATDAAGAAPVGLGLDAPTLAVSQPSQASSGIAGAAAAAVVTAQPVPLQQLGLGRSQSCATSDCGISPMPHGHTVAGSTTLGAELEISRSAFPSSSTSGFIANGNSSSQPTTTAPATGSGKATGPQLTAVVVGAATAAAHTGKQHSDSSFKEDISFGEDAAFAGVPPAIRSNNNTSSSSSAAGGSDARATAHACSSCSRSAAGRRATAVMQVGPVGSSTCGTGGGAANDAAAGSAAACVGAACEMGAGGLSAAGQVPVSGGVDVCMGGFSHLDEMELLEDYVCEGEDEGQQEQQECTRPQWDRADVRMVREQAIGGLFWELEQQQEDGDGAAAKEQQKRRFVPCELLTNMHV